MIEATVSLVPFTKSHVDKTFVWVSDSDFQHSFLMRGRPTREGHRAYFSRVLEDSSQGVFAIMYGDIHCGNCGFKNIVPGKESELWIYIGDASLRGKNIGYEAVRLLIQKGFDVLNLKLIYVHFGDFNTTARQLYERMGFRQVPLKEGTNEQWLNRQCEIIRMELARI
jgi:RimJ/RimL family protein N-acetyltransferase